MERCVNTYLNISTVTSLPTSFFLTKPKDLYANNYSIVVVAKTKQNSTEAKLRKVMATTDSVRVALNSLGFPWRGPNDVDQGIIDNTMPYFEKSHNPNLVRHFQAKGVMDALGYTPRGVDKEYDSGFHLGLLLGKESVSLDRQVTDELGSLLAVPSLDEEVSSHAREALANFFSAGRDLATAFGSGRNGSEEVVITRGKMKYNFELQLGRDTKRDASTNLIPDEKLLAKLDETSRKEDSIFRRFFTNSEYHTFIVSPEGNSNYNCHVKATGDKRSTLFTFSLPAVNGFRELRPDSYAVIEQLFTREIKAYEGAQQQARAAFQECLPAYITGLILRDGPVAVENWVQQHGKYRDNTTDKGKRAELNTALRQQRPLIPFLEKASALYR